MLGFIIIVTGAWFVRAFVSAWRVQPSAGLGCEMTFDRTQPLSYIQYNIKGQTPEPYFQGGFFISLGDVPSGPAQADVVTTGGRYYGSTTTHVELFRDEQSKTFWMRKEADNVPFVRQSGLPRDFPFDSTTIDFDTTFKPALPLSGLMIRNFDPSFYIPCDMVHATEPSCAANGVCSICCGGLVCIDYSLQREKRCPTDSSFIFLLLRVVHTRNPKLGDDSISHPI